MKQIINLQQHNLETYKAIQKAFIKRNHVGTVQATGTGKSYIAAKLMQNDVFNNVLFLTPSLHIINQFKETFPFLEEKTTFMTYKKLSYIKDLKTFTKEEDFDLVILDEYHRCGARTWGSAVKVLLSTYSNKKVLGVTATPIRFLDDCRDMTKELFNSEPVMDLSLLDAINMDILKRPKYILASYDSEAEAKMLEKKSEVIDDKEVLDDIRYVLNNMNKIVNIENVLKSNITSERKFIVFCSNVSHAKEMSSIVPRWFKNIGFKTKVYSLYTNKGDAFNNNKMRLEAEEFKKSLPKDNEVELLFCVNILNEGVHIKGIDGLIFLRKTASPIIAGQQLGRALNARSKKIPIVFDLVNNITELSFNDSCFKSDKKTLNEKNKTYSNFVISGNIEIKDYTVDLRNLLKEIDKASNLSSWKSFVEELREYKNKYGNCNVPSRHKLYKRCLRLKKLYQKGLLEEQQYLELSAMDFDFNISTYCDKRWEEMFTALEEFVEIYGHANVPRNYKDSKLATWVCTQRKFRDTMSNERRKKLLSLGFKFELAKVTNDKKWEAMYSRLLEFKSQYGHTNVSSRYKDKELANWVHTQRKAYKAGKLLSERYDRLSMIGFKFLKGEK